MSIKNVLALASIALGIWLNLELQDVMAERNIHGWESTQLKSDSAVLSAREQDGQWSATGRGAEDVDHAF